MPRCSLLMKVCIGGKRQGGLFQKPWFFYVCETHFIIKHTRNCIFFWSGRSFNRQLCSHALTIFSLRWIITEGKRYLIMDESGCGWQRPADTICSESAQTATSRLQRLSLKLRLTDHCTALLLSFMIWTYYRNNLCAFYCAEEHLEWIVAQGPPNKPSSDKKIEPFQNWHQF